MKRIIAVLLAIVIGIFASGCKAQVSDVKFENINDFIEKYKRESLDSVTDNPDSFINDLMGLRFVSEDGLEAWTINQTLSSEYATWYESDEILFNFPSDMSLVFSALGIDPWFSLSIDVGEHSSNVDTAEGFCKYMFDTYGDASSVEINDEDSNEHNLRDLWNEMDYSKSFSCSWEIGDKENSMRLTISYNYYEITSSEFSHFGVSV